MNKVMLLKEITAEDSIGDAYNEEYTAAEVKLEVLSQAKQPVEVTAKAKLERTGSLRAATLSSKEHEGILVEKHKLDVKGELRVQWVRLVEMLVLAGRVQFRRAKGAKHANSVPSASGCSQKKSSSSTT